MDPNLFVPVAATAARRRGRSKFRIDPHAAVTCARCPVADECRQWAEREHETLIVAAGELTAGWSHRGQTFYEPVECGTDPGYYRHRRDGSDACDPCKDAHNQAERARIVRRRMALKGVA